MAKRRRVIRPQIVRPAGAGLRIFAFLTVLVALAGAFAGGTLLGRTEVAELSEQMQALERDRGSLATQIADLRQHRVVLERTQQVDQEANRAARERLRESQARRLDLEKEISFLRRLIREGGGGIVQVKDFEREQPSESELVYRFTVSQLVPDFGWSEGEVEVRLTGTQDGEEQTFTLAQLEGSEPVEHRMRFQHFQTFEGQIRVPEGLVAENLVVEVKPKSKKLIAATEMFPLIGDEGDAEGPVAAESGSGP